MTDRLAEIEEAYDQPRWGCNENCAEELQVRWLIGEVKRLQGHIRLAKDALTYVGPLNEYEALAVNYLDRAFVDTRTEQQRMTDSFGVPDGLAGMESPW